MRRFRTHDLVVETKADLTPVTAADRDAESLLRERIAAARPGDGVVGEEYGDDPGNGTRRWVLDPIDGTKSFVRGAPIWASLIALEVEGGLALGVVSAPALGRRWWAARGAGAFADGAPIRVSEVAGLADALLCYTSAASFYERGLGDPFRSLAERSWSARGFGDFWGHVLVAEGVADVMVEPQVNLWDLAPLLVIVEEAGGRLTDFTGVARADGGSVVTTNGYVHDEVLAVLASDGG